MALGARFFGRYEHALDAKGRLILPSKLRGPFGQHGFLAPHLEGCLALWPEEEFEKEVEARLSQAEGEPAARNAVRDWASEVADTEIDRQGRMAIAPSLRGYAALEQEVLVIGMINRVELWSPASWATRELATAAAGAR